MPNMNEKSDEEKGGFFRPVIGFCICTRTIGGDGLKIRTIDGGRNLYVNICSYKGIERPKNNRGQIVNEFNEKDLEIPLVIGPVRYEEDIDNNNDQCLVVDVILHVSVIDHCNVNNSFKREVVDLALSCIESERKIQYRKDWKVYSKRYIFGRGVDKLTPVLFPMNNDVPNPEANNISSPNDLLNQVLKTREPLEGLSNINIDLNEKKKVNNNNKSSDVNINLNLNLKDNAISDQLKPKQQQQQQQQQSAIKKGFLEKNAGALYPNGLPKNDGDNGSVLDRIMDKCKVINMKNDTDGNTVMNALNDPPISKSSKMDDSKLRPSKLETMLMDDLVASLDDEYSFSNKKSDSTSQDNDFTAQLSNLAKAFVKDDFATLSAQQQPPSSSSSSTAAKATASTTLKTAHVEGTALKVKSNTFNNDKRIFIENNIENPNNIIIKIDNLNMSMSDIDLNISLAEIMITLPGNKEKLSLVLDNGQIDKNKVEASFSKKTKHLKIKIYCTSN